MILIRLEYGFVYLCTVIDWYSKEVLCWTLSTTMESESCVSTYRRAVNLCGAPELLNAVQENQIASKAYRTIVNEIGTTFSMNR